MEGIIIKNISNTYTVKANDNFYDCKPRGKFRFDKLTPLVGDHVIIDPDNNYLLDILDRKNELNRPDIANVDMALIVTSVKKPNLDLLLLDKLLCNVIKEKITPVICFTKLDLISLEERSYIDILIKYYNSIGIKTFTNEDLESLKKALSNNIIVLTGQTGAGKSSLINKLSPEFDLKTSPISEALGRGVHTTRNTEIYPVLDFYVADTPGFSSVDLTKVDPEMIKSTFYEFRDATCKYGDCKHDKEDDCGVKTLVNAGKILKSRYDNYLKILSDNSYKKY